MEMTITRGLAELKLLDKRIEKAIQDNAVVGIASGKNPVKGYTSIEAFEAAAKSNYQSVLDLIKRRQAIKSAIVKSNAVTMVNIAGVEMTVAEAIERKTSIVFEQNLLRKMQYDYNKTIDLVEQKNENVKKELDKLLIAHFGKETKGKEMEMSTITKQYVEINESKVIDPINVRSKIEQLQERIDTFLTEVDFVLSESNTVTRIEIAE